VFDCRASWATGTVLLGAGWMVLSWARSFPGRLPFYPVWSVATEDVQLEMSPHLQKVADRTACVRASRGRWLVSPNVSGLWARMRPFGWPGLFLKLNEVKF